MNTIHPYKSQPELDADHELAEYIQRCRIMHHSITGAPRFAHAVSALADQRDALLDRVARLERAIREACDSFRSLGCSVDAGDLEEAVRTAASAGEKHGD